MYLRQRDIVRIQCVDTHKALRTGPAMFTSYSSLITMVIVLIVSLPDQPSTHKSDFCPFTPAKQLCLKILMVSLSLNPKGIFQSSSYLTSRELTVPFYFEHSFPSVSLRIPFQLEVSYSCPRRGFGWHWRGSLITLHEPMSRQFKSPVLGSPLTL